MKIALNGITVAGYVSESYSNLIVKLLNEHAKTSCYSLVEDGHHQDCIDGMMIVLQFKSEGLAELLVVDNVRSDLGQLIIDLLHQAEKHFASWTHVFKPRDYKLSVTRNNSCN